MPTKDTSRPADGTQPADGTPFERGAQLADGTRRVELLEAPRCWLAESPRWAEGAWWWLDAATGDIFTIAAGGPLSADDRGRHVLALGSRTSLVHPAAGGEIVVARGPSIERVTRDADGWRTTAVWCLLELPDGTVLNDGTADAAGRLWIGSVGPDRRPEQGALIRIDPDGSAQVVRTGFALSNGMVWDGSTDTLLHVDSLARTLWRHRVDPATGEVLTSDAAVVLPDDDGLPDGIALDAEGYVWIAVYGRGEVRRYDPDGAVERVVQVPTPQTTSVALGGPDGRDLLITTAREGFDEARSAAEPLAGRIFRGRAPTAGVDTWLARPRGRPGR